MKLGVRSPIPGESLRKKAKVLKRTGFEGIELGPEYLNQSAEEILQKLSGTGIAVTAIVGSIKLLDRDKRGGYFKSQRIDARNRFLYPRSKSLLIAETNSSFAFAVSPAP